MGTPVDVIISWYATSAQLTSKLAMLQRPYKLIEMPIPDGKHYLTQVQNYGWPHPLRGILQHYGVDSPLRCAAIGFSEGCQGVRALLASADAGYIEHVFAIDGMQCSWIGGQPNSNRDNICCPGTPALSNCIGNLIASANLASRGPSAVGDAPPGQHYFTLTHSSIVPPNSPSTTEVAHMILDTLFKSGWPTQSLPDGILGAVHDPPVSYNSHGQKTTYDHAPSKYAAGQHGLTVLGYSNVDPRGYNDHLYQAYSVLPTVFEKLLVPRWNAIDPTQPTCTSGTVSALPAPGATCNPISPARLPDGYMADPVDASLNANQFTPAESGAPGSTTALEGLLMAGASAAGAWGVWKLLDWLWERHAR